MKLIALAAAAAALLPAAQAAAQTPVSSAERGRFALGAQVGTPGAGLQAQFAVNDYLVLRGGYDALQWDRDDTYDGIDYEADIDFKSPGAFVDLHPFKNPFFVSAGAYFGTRKVDLNASGGTLSDQPAFQDRLAEEEREIQADADDYKVLPVVQIGLNYRF